MNTQEKITFWICSDRPVYEYARDVIDGKREYGDDLPWKALSMLVSDLLYGDNGSMYRMLCRSVPGGHPVDRSALLDVRDAIAQRDLGFVNWKEVADEVVRYGELWSLET